MIIDFSFGNYKSFKDGQDFSMRRDTSIELEKPSIINKVLPNEGLNRVSAIYGANASGKTNFLEAIVALKTFIEFGKISKVNFVNNKKPSSFKIIFYYGGKKYSYMLETFNDEIFCETLYIYNSNQPSLIFDYSKNSHNLKLSKSFSSEESTAIKYNSQKEPNKPILHLLKDSDNRDARNAFRFFKFGIDTQYTPENDEKYTEARIRGIIKTNPIAKRFYDSVISAADLGIENVKTISVERDTNLEMNDEQLDILADAVIKIDEIGGKQLSNEDKEKLKKSVKGKIERTRFTHKIDNSLVDFGFGDESHGTIVASNIFLDLQKVLEYGSVYIVDEIDCSIHPTIVTQIINIFNSADTNPNGAQLIFSTHDISILDSSIYGENVLDRDQVWFVEKNKDGQSSLYSLTQIGGMRKDDNLYRKYISGRYGAIPKVSLYYKVLEYWENKKSEKRK